VTNVRVLATALMILLVAGAAAPAPQSGYPPQWEQRGGQRDTREPFPRPPGDRSLSEREKQDRLDFLAKMLARNLSVADAGADMLFLSSRASELLERAKQARANNFQFDSLTGAILNLLRASERISMARKADRMDENDKRDAALQLQKCYFRVQQADYFAGLSGEKDAKQYLTRARSLYQQARSAYDSRQYDRAQLLGDAASNIVTALENLAHACLRIPDPPVIK
jgi:hypothetical protein